MNKKSVEFHIKSDDYFGTLATILSLNREMNKSIPQNIINDLIFLQNNYKIVKK